MWTDKQKDYIHNADKRWNIKVGATGTGKTYLDYNYTILDRVMELKGKEGLCLLIGVSNATIERNVLSPMRDIYGKQFISDIKKGDNTVNLFGETFHVIGAEKSNAINRIRGITAKYVYGDEFVDWNKDFFTMLTTRLRTEHSIADLTGNPKSPNHWAKEFIDNQLKGDDEGNIRIFYQTSTIYDNPTLPKEFVKAQEQELYGTADYQRLLLGQWVMSEGQIYSMFKRDRHVVDFNDIKNDIKSVQIGIDFGGNKSKTTFQCTGISAIGNNIKYIATIKERKFEEEKDMNYMQEQFLQFITDVEDMGYPIRDIRADSADQVAIRSLQNYLTQNRKGYVIKNSIKGAILDRIRLYQRLFNTDRYYIVKECKHTIEAFENAIWSDKQDKDGKDIRLDDGTTNIDTLDAQEYSTESITKLLLRE